MPQTKKRNFSKSELLANLAEAGIIPQQYSTTSELRSYVRAKTSQQIGQSSFDPRERHPYPNAQELVNGKQITMRRLSRAANELGIGVEKLVPFIDVYLNRKYTRFAKILDYPTREDGSDKTLLAMELVWCATSG